MKDSILYVVEVKRPDGTWAPAWDGDGGHIRKEIAEHYQSDSGLEGEETRVAEYVRREAP